MDHFLCEEGAKYAFIYTDFRSFLGIRVEKAMHTAIHLINKYFSSKVMIPHGQISASIPVSEVAYSLHNTSA